MSDLNMAMDLTRLPAERPLRGSGSMGLFLSLFGLVWGGVPTLVLISGLAEGGADLEWRSLILFPAIGLALLIAGLNQWAIKGRIRVGATEVLYERRSLFGRKDWVEPLARYTGLACRMEHHSGGKNRPSYTLHLVELQHPDNHKRIITYQSKSPDGVRGVLEDHCRALKLPALEETAGGWVARAPEDLDKSVRELAKERKLTVSFDPRQPPPAGILLRVEGDRLHLTLSLPRLPGLVGLPFAALGILFLLLGLLVPAVGVLFLLLGFGLTLAPAAFWWVTRRVRQELTLSRSEARASWSTPFGELRAVELPADEIESVEVRGPAGGRGAALTIVTDRRQVVVGVGLKPEAQQWLRDCILAVLAA